MSEEENLGPGKQVGRSWRLLARRDSGNLAIENEGEFDELVLDQWFHLERMQARLWWLRVGDARLLVELQEDDSAVLTIERGFYGESPDDHSGPLPNPSG